MAVLVVILVLLVVSNVRIYRRRKAIDLEAKILKEKIEALSQEKTDLHSKIFQSQGLDYLEKVARDDLNLKKEGERVVAFPVVEPPAPKEENTAQKNLWQKILDKIK